MPNIIQSQCGILLLSHNDPPDSFKKHNGGNTKANTVAEKPPVNSSTIPKLQVNNEMLNVIKISAVVIRKCRVLSNGADGQ